MAEQQEETVKSSENSWMGKLIATLIILAIIFIAWNSLIKIVKVGPGEEAVLIKQPLFFGKAGVEQKTYTTGRVWTIFSTTHQIVNVKPFLIRTSFTDLITADNNPVDFRVHLTFQYQKGQGYTLVEEFGIKNHAWYHNNVREPLRKKIREFTKKKKMFEMTTNPLVVLELQNLIKKFLNDILYEKGMPINVKEVKVGKVTPPKEVLDETIRTGIEKQKTKTNNNRVEAEIARKQAEIASAEADKAYMQKMGLTPAQYLEMKAIQASKDGGNVKLNIIMGQNSDNRKIQPVIDISKR